MLDTALVAHDKLDRSAELVAVRGAHLTLLCADNVRFLLSQKFEKGNLSLSVHELSLSIKNVNVKVVLLQVLGESHVLIGNAAHRAVHFKSDAQQIRVRQRAASLRLNLAVNRLDESLLCEVVGLARHNFLEVRSATRAHKTYRVSLNLWETEEPELEIQSLGNTALLSPFWCLETNEFKLDSLGLELILSFHVQVHRSLRQGLCLTARLLQQVTETHLDQGDLILFWQVNNLQKVQTAVFDMRHFRTHQVVKLTCLKHGLDLVSKVDKARVFVTLAHKVQHVIENVSDHLDLLAGLQLVILNTHALGGS